MKTVKYYIFKFKLRDDVEFCEDCDLIDTYLLVYGKKLNWYEKEMQYALNRFLKDYDGHDMSNFCIIPKTIFNDSCIYEHIGRKVYLITPTYLTDRNLLSYKYPELVGQVYDRDLTDMYYLPKEEKEPNATMDIVEDLFGKEIVKGD